jgi:hypothetical protein
MSSSTPPAPPCFAVTPQQWATNANLKEVAARYRAFNEGLAKRLGDAPEPSRVIETAKLKESYFIECSVCGKRGPGGETIFSGTMAGQRAGFTYDSATLKAGSKVRWFCPTHKEKKS